MTRTMFKGMFFNPFSNEDYSLVGLCLFGNDAIARMDTEFPDAVAAVQAAVDRATVEDAEVRLALGQQLGRTGSVDAFLGRLHEVMKERQDTLSAALGGRKGEGYLAFYPDGLKTYTQLTKREAPAVMRALTLAVNSYGARLDAATKSTLLGLETEWTAVRGAQQETMGEVSTGKVEKKTARQQLEAALWAAARAVLDRYTGNPEKCLSYFREHLLREVSRAGAEEEGREEANG
ncbi:MAG: hypothetical protein EOO16_07990 [Chitinophagaceae bacterium]|nr:MAG: hypothetical protein EOO16_07990 [Chitinophagaceae bacterium]